MQGQTQAQPPNGWRQTKVTIGLLVAIVAAAASVITGLLFVGGQVENKVGKAVSTHDTCVRSHGDIRERCRRTEVRATKAYRAVRVELRAVRDALTAQRVQLDLVLDSKRGRRIR